MRFITKYKKVITFLLIVLMSFSSFSSLFLKSSETALSAHQGFFIECVLNEASFTYDFITLLEEDEHQQAEWGHFEDASSWDFQLFSGKNYLSYASSTGTTAAQRASVWTDFIGEYVEKKWYKLSTWGAEDADSTGLIYVFPGIHAKIENGYLNGTTLDQNRCVFVAETLGTALNDAIYFVTSNSGFTGQETQYTISEYLISLGIDMSNAGTRAVKKNASAQSFTFNGTKFTVEAAKSLDSKSAAYISGVPLKMYAGVDIAESYNYITITCDKNDNSITVPFKIPKGYYYDSASFSSSAIQSSFSAEEVKAYKADGSYDERLLPTYYQPLCNKIPTSFQDTITQTDAACLSWSHFVLQAAYLQDVKGISAGSSSTVYKPGYLEKHVVDLLDKCVSALSNLLGLYSFNELVFNKGSRYNNTYLGLMNYSWYAAGKFFYYLMQLLAAILLAASIVKLAMQRMVSAIRPVSRVNLLEGLMNIVIASFAVVFALPFMQIMFQFNNQLVSVFSMSSDTLMYFNTNTWSGGGGGGTLGSILIMIAFLVVNIYFNFIYIVRGVTITVLIGVAPLACCSIAFGEKFKTLYSKWLKELTSNVFMQLFHGVIMAIFSQVFSFGQNRLIETLVILYAFIPLTKWFKDLISDGGGGLADSAGAGALGLVGSLTGGAMHLLGSSSSHGSSSSDSISGTSPYSMGNMYDDEPLSGGTGTVSPKMTTFPTGTSGGVGANSGEVPSNVTVSAAKVARESGMATSSGLGGKISDGIAKINESKVGKAANMAAPYVVGAAKMAKSAVGIAAYAGVALGMTATGNSSFVRTAGYGIGRNLKDMKSTVGSMAAQVGADANSVTAMMKGYEYEKSRLYRGKNNNIDIGATSKFGMSNDFAIGNEGGLLAFSRDEATGAYSMTADKDVIATDYGIIGGTTQANTVTFETKANRMLPMMKDNANARKSIPDFEDNDRASYNELAKAYNTTGSVSSVIGQSHITSNGKAYFNEKLKEQTREADAYETELEELAKYYPDNDGANKALNESVRTGLKRDYGITHVKRQGDGTYAVSFDKRATGIEKAVFGGARKMTADIKFSDSNCDTELQSNSNLGLPNLKNIKAKNLSTTYAPQTKSKNQGQNA